MHDPGDRLPQLLASRPLIVQLERVLEDRVRLFADGLNARLAVQGDTDPYHVDEDEELANVIMLLCEATLDDDDEATLSRR